MRGHGNDAPGGAQDRVAPAPARDLGLETLAEVLRNTLNLNGTKVSCEVQVCGACTVLVDGAPVSACTYLAYEARGKSVLTIEGLEKPDGGEIHLGDRWLVSGSKRLFIKPEKRDMGMVFQSYALWPHMTVFENVVYPLKLRGIKGREAEKKVAEVLELVGLAGLEERPAPALSGGQQQRVAIARTLALRPSVILMDEPFGALDAQTRDVLQQELQEITRRLRTTVLFVTHNVREAACLGDRVIVFSPRPGRIREEFAVDLPRPRDINSVDLAVHATEIMKGLKSYSQLEVAIAE